MADEGSSTSTSNSKPSISFAEPESYEHDTKRRRMKGGCFPFMEISIDPSIKSLKHLDSRKVKEDIRRWAKAVVTYARQVSQHFGSSRKSNSMDDKSSKAISSSSFPASTTPHGE